MKNNKIKLIALAIVGGLAIIVIIWNFTRGESIPTEAQEVVESLKADTPPEIPPPDPAKQKPAVGFKIK